MFTRERVEIEKCRHVLRWVVSIQVRVGRLGTISHADDRVHWSLPVAPQVGLWAHFELAESAGLRVGCNNSPIGTALQILKNKRFYLTQNDATFEARDTVSTSLLALAVKFRRCNTTDVFGTFGWIIRRKDEAIMLKAGPLIIDSELLKGPAEMVADVGSGVCTPKRTEGWNLKDHDKRYDIQKVTSWFRGYKFQVAGYYFFLFFGVYGYSQSKKC